MTRACGQRCETRNQRRIGGALDQCYDRGLICLSFRLVLSVGVNQRDEFRNQSFVAQRFELLAFEVESHRGLERINRISQQGVLKAIRSLLISFRTKGLLLVLTDKLLLKSYTVIADLKNAINLLYSNFRCINTLMF